MVTNELPEDVRIMTRGLVNFAFNYGAVSHTLDIAPGAQFLAGGAELPPRGFAIWRNE